MLMDLHIALRTLWWLRDLDFRSLQPNDGCGTLVSGSRDTWKARNASWMDV